MIRDLLTVIKNRRQREPQPLEWTPELVDRFWDGVWTTRLKECSFAKQAGRALIVAIDHLLPPGTRVLDFGAGVGDLAALLLERHVGVGAYDPSPVARATLDRRFRAHEEYLGTIGPSDWTTFDVVVMAEVIEHVLETEFDETLRRVARLTAPGGLVVVTTPNNEDLALGMCVDPISNVVFHRWQHMRAFTGASLAACLTRYGFQDVVTHELELSEHLYVPHDRLWGTEAGATDLPSHLVEMRANHSCWAGGRQNLVYIGRRRE